MQLVISNNLINYIFIGIHVIVIVTVLLNLTMIRVAVAIGLASGKVSDQDKKQTTLVMQTMGLRIYLGLLYWVLPIGLYLQRIVEIKYLYIFVWLPLWYPIIYYLIESHIKRKEKRIGSPLAE
ncbi:MAG: hypothetical protein A2571_03330 [Candidatus Vogelbacteria bacterium RIFOXYD1_FULL_44_32]|uniref:Uncharacterized protein n=1 Tax=Candidatus Vogelbacteria bacterium RIFOXYD1_FULL_44_32 TaxID=1802438 RepID=A0A1G2QE73_9BACT|nr:MAG: hypothetical protein A2571_03330 [Candidatus Vogelbacteria bacterium RIFOXYD1_FULL_44_32]